MAETFQFDLVSPERSLASTEAREVRIPGAEGDLVAMAGHTPVITTLRPGILSVSSASGDESFLVTGGFAEISGESVSVLAERAFPQDAVTSKTLSELLAEATAAKESAAADAVDAAAKFVADMEAAGAELGLR